MTFALNDTRLLNPTRGFTLSTSDGVVSRQAELPPAAEGEVVQSLTFDSLPTFRKRYSLTVHDGEGDYDVVDDCSVLDLLEVIEGARQDLVSADTEIDTRVAFNTQPEGVR